MKKATPTNGYSPTVPCKPAEFIRCLAGISASCGRPETAYLVNTAVRIGKCVLVGALHFDAFSRSCYYPTALATEYVFIYVRFFLVCLSLNKVTWLFTAIFLIRLSKKISGVITCNHFLLEIVCCLLLVVSGLFSAN